jgi:hypothetical protein
VPTPKIAWLPAAIIVCKTKEKEKTNRNNIYIIKTKGYRGINKPV